MNDAQKYLIDNKLNDKHLNDAATYTSDAMNGFAKEQEKLIVLLKKTLKAQSRLLVTYRTGGQPPEWVFNDLEKARKAGLEI